MSMSDGGTPGTEAVTTKESGVSLTSSAKLEAMEKAGKLKRIAFKDRAEMKKLVDPVLMAYAKEIEAESIMEQINNVK